MRNVGRTTRPGANEGVRREVPRGFPVFSYRGGRYGPAVTGAVQPMLPAAGLPIRLRPGLSRRPSSACAAARPGPPAGHRTRRSGPPRRSRAPSAAAGGAGATARRRPSTLPGNKAVARARTTTGPPPHHAAISQQRALPPAPGWKPGRQADAGGSHVHELSISQVGAQLYPGSLAMPTPQSFSMASPPSLAHGFGVDPDTAPPEPRTAHRPRSARFEPALRLRGFSH